MIDELKIGELLKKWRGDGIVDTWYDFDEMIAFAVYCLEHNKELEQTKGN